MNTCPRCKTGRLQLRWFSTIQTATTCITCGYEAFDIPEDVLTEVAQTMGKPKLHQIKKTKAHMLPTK